MTKRLTLIAFALLFAATFAKAQSQNDTANNPYWIEMMQDKNVNFYQTQRAFELYWQNRPIQKGNGWKVFKRWEWLAEKVIDSAGNFPDEGMQWQVLQMMIQQTQTSNDVDRPGLGAGTVDCLQQGNWKELGPVLLPTNNTGQINGMGRINAVALHPTDTNIIYAGAAAGGIWKTENGGQNWAVYGDSLPTLGVSAIAIDPNSPDTMYFGSGDRDNSDASGFGVFKSTNGGQTWALSNSGMGNRTVGKLIIDPSNTSILLAATNNGIYRSTNRGSSWSQVQSGGSFKDIIFMPNNSNYVYATHSGLFYRSTNNGVNWSQITTGIPTTSVSRAVIDVNANDSTLVYVWIANGSVNRGFYLSRNGGTSFTTQSTTPNLHDYATNGSGSSGQAWYNKDMVTDPSNPAVIYCGGVNIFRSSDTGKTWTIAGYWVNEIHADQHELVACPITNKIFAGNDGGLYYSRNQGDDWAPIKSGLAVAQIYKLGASRTDKDKVITGFQDNGTGNYSNGWYTTRGGDGMDCEVDQSDSRYSYGALYYGEIFRVFNQNSQGTIAQQGYTATGSDTINEAGDWVTPYTLNEDSSSTMYIGYKNIWRSQNIKSSTVTWKKISNNLGGTNTVNFTELENCIANPNILYASRSNGTFFRSDNVNAGSPTWNTLTQPVSGTINAIETDPQSDQVVYIGVSNKVYRSINKGSSWTQVGGNLSHNVACILLDTSGSKKELYVGTMGGGAWYIDSTLTAWQYFSKGMPATSRVTDLEMYYDNGSACNANRLYASTYNRGTWYTGVYNDGTEKPVAMLNAYDTIICKNNVVSFTDNSCNDPVRFRWEFTPNTVTYVNGTDTSTANAEVQFSSPGVYGFKFMAENCVGIDTIPGQIIVSDTVKTACVPTTTNNISGLGIFNVELGSFSRSSSGRNPEGAYVDLACEHIIKLKKGQVYTMNVTTGSTYDEQVKAFIDFNNNGTLNNTGELIYQPASALQNHSDTFSVPQNAVTGKVLRMRIRSDFTSIGTDPCGTLGYGQTEDYGIYIEPESITPEFAVNDSIICNQGSVSYTDLSSGTGNSYSWNFGSGASPQTANTQGPHNVTYTSAGYKTVSLTIDGITTAIDSMVLVQPNPELNISFTVGDTSVCTGKPFSLKATDANNIGATYQWYLNNTLITDSTQSTYTEGGASQADSGLYSIIATKGSCVDTAYRLVSVNPLPVPAFTINNDVQCLNSNNFTFSNNSTNSTGSFTSKWYFGNGNTSDNTSASHAYSSAGTFAVKLVLTGNTGCKDSITKNITVDPSPTAAFTVNDSTQCLNTNDFIFGNTSSIGSGTMSHNWTFGDGNSSTSTSPTHNYTTAGSFTAKLVATSNKGCKDSTTKNITVHHVPAPGFTINDSTQCFNGHDFDFTGTGSISSGTFNTLWNFGDNSTGSGTNANHSYNAVNTYNVKQVLTSNLGCSDSITAKVYLYDSPTASFTINNNAQCFNGNRFDFTDNSTITTGTLSSFWELGDGTTASGSSTTKSYNTTGSFDIKLISTSNMGCSDSLSKSVTVHPNAVPAFGINDNTQCFNGNSFAFTNNTTLSGATYSSAWKFGDGSSHNGQIPSAKTYAALADSFTVTLVVTTSDNCIDSISNPIYLLPEPVAGFTVNDSNQCQNGNNFSFTNTSTVSKGNIVSSWKFGDGNTSQSTSPNHSYTSAGTYTVKLITNAGGCLDSVEKLVVVHEKPAVSFSVLNGKRCEKDNLFEFVNSSSVGSGNLSHQWKFGDQNSSSATAPNHSYNAAGTYVVWLKSTSDKNCSDSVQSQVVVHPNPVAGFTPNKSGQCLAGNEFILQNTSSIQSGSLSYQWDFGDGTTSTTTSPKKTYAAIATYPVQIIVISDKGCRDTSSQNLEVFSQPQANITVISNNVCIGDTAILEVQNPGTGNRFQWLRNASAQNADTLSSINVLSASSIHLVLISGPGCLDTSSAVQVTFKALPTKPVISRTAYTLFAGSGYSDYQWFTGTQEINGAENDSLSVVQNGSYSVKVGNTDGCFIMSDPISVINVGIEDIGKNPDISVYPNPNEGLFVIESEEEYEADLYDPSGKHIRQLIIQKGKNEVDISTYAAGVYLLKVKANEKTVSYRVVKN